MKYAVEMGSDAMIYIPNFINFGSGTRKFTGVNHGHTDAQSVCRSQKSTLIFSK
jgi:hypothetical protein